jgi:hypothetical protein
MIFHDTPAGARIEVVALDRPEHGRTGIVVEVGRHLSTVMLDSRIVHVQQFYNYELGVADEQANCASTR